MSTQQKLERAVATIKPLVEKATGRQTPPFVIEAREGTRYEGMMSVEGMDPEGLRFRYTPSHMESALAKDAGVMFYNIARELVHVGNIRAILSRRRTPNEQLRFSQSRGPLHKFREWYEGTATLGALSVCIPLIEGRKTEEATRQAFGHARGDTIQDACVESVSKALLTSRTRHLFTPSPDSVHLQTSDLGIRLGPRLTAAVDEELERWPINADFDRTDHLPYHFGLYRCAQAVAMGRVTMSGILGRAYNMEELITLGRPR